MSAEGIVLCGGGAAILLQIANPAVAAGVSRHSDFSSAPMRRLDGTLDYVTAVVHGNASDRELVIRKVDRSHRYVRGSGYDARDPQLQLWVAATLYYAAKKAHARAFGAPTGAASQSMLEVFGDLATALQVPANYWPRTHEEFNQWWNVEIAKADIGADARGVFYHLRYPSGTPRLLRFVIPLIMRVSLEMLPTKLRMSFYPEWSRFDRFLVELFWALVVPVYRLLPRGVRTGLVRIQLRRLREKA